MSHTPDVMRARLAWLLQDKWIPHNLACFAELISSIIKCDSTSLAPFAWRERQRSLARCMVERFVRMDGSMLKRNLKVIVHCNGGKGRSGLVVCCVRI